MTSAALACCGPRPRPPLELSRAAADLAWSGVVYLGVDGSADQVQALRTPGRGPDRRGPPTDFVPTCAGLGPPGGSIGCSLRRPTSVGSGSPSMPPAAAPGRAACWCGRRYTVESRRRRREGGSRAGVAFRLGSPRWRHRRAAVRRRCPTTPDHSWSWPGWRARWRVWPKDGPPGRSRSWCR